MVENGAPTNRVHVWLNTGDLNKPTFENDSKVPLAIGDGRKYLTPSVYDWNGDGIPDLIVGDREGRVALYLGTAEAIKDPKNVAPVEFTKFITIGGREKLGTMLSPHACDYNNDGLPDLLYGTTTGLAMVALGEGRRVDPELVAARPIKGVDVAKDFKQPMGWEVGAYSGLPEVVSKADNPNADLGH